MTLSLSVRATALKGVKQARAAEHLATDAKYDATAAALEARLEAPETWQEGAMDLAKKYPADMRVTPGPIDNAVMMLGPTCQPHIGHDNDMVLEMCYAPGKFPAPDARPSCIALLKGDENDPRAKTWYHVVKPGKLDEALRWAAQHGGLYGATLHLSRLPAWKVAEVDSTKLQRLWVFLLVTGVAEEPATEAPATGERYSKHRKLS